MTESFIENAGFKSGVNKWVNKPHMSRSLCPSELVLVIPYVFDHSLSIKVIVMACWSLSVIRSMQGQTGD